MNWLPIIALAMAAGIARAQTVPAPTTAELLSMMEDHADEAAAIEQMVEQGHAMFRSACSQCHDTETSTSAKKNYEAWLVTVRRMANKSGSEVQRSQIEPIAAYLASLNPHIKAAEQPDAVHSTFETALKSSVTFNAAVSLLWRDSDAIQANKGFLADVWVGAEWRPEGNPLSITVTACTSCHESAGGGMSFELLEGSLTADLIHLISGQSSAERTSDLKATAKAGRFIVPFGAFSEMVHPGTYRTLTVPLMYNMGRGVGSEEFRAPVLPLPYADEGINLHLEIPLPTNLKARFDAYAVNGLQQGFYSSRSYSDNNSDVAIGGRVTLGNSWVRVGGSASSGEMQTEGAPTQEYHLLGGDITLRYLDWVRFRYEYARRKEDTIPTAESQVEGHVGEVEGKIWSNPKISLILRYDTIDHSGLLGEATTDRFTWGPVLTLPGGSLLIFNHEHWMFDTNLGNEDVLGFRWVAWF